MGGFGPISTANPILITSKKAGLAGRSKTADRISFPFLTLIFIYFFKYETIVRSSAWSFGYSDSDPSTVWHEKGRWMFSYVDVYLGPREHVFHSCGPYYGWHSFVILPLCTYISSMKVCLDKLYLFWSGTSKVIRKVSLNSILRNIMYVISFKSFGKPNFILEYFSFELLSTLMNNRFKKTNI